MIRRMLETGLYHYPRYLSKLFLELFELEQFGHIMQKIDGDVDKTSSSQEVMDQNIFCINE